MKIKVVCDGISRATRITEAETGAPLPPIERISFMADAKDRDGWAGVDVTFAAPIEIEAPARFTIRDPQTGDEKPIVAILFADGSEFRP